MKIIVETRGKILSRADKMMIRWMCNVSLKDGRSSDEIRDKLGIPDITEVLRKNRLRWFRHVMKIDVGNPANACRHVVIEGKREQGRPRKPWFQLVSNDFRRMKLNPKLARDRRLWKRARPTHASIYAKR